jgi:hypothetical protein
MATSLLANGVQFPSGTVQTDASVGSGVSALQYSPYSPAQGYSGANIPIAVPINDATELSPTLSNLHPDFTFDFGNMIYVGRQYYANASVSGPTNNPASALPPTHPAKNIPDRPPPFTPGQLFHRIMYRTA